MFCPASVNWKRRSIRLIGLVGLGAYLLLYLGLGRNIPTKLFFQADSYDALALFNAWDGRMAIHVLMRGNYNILNIVQGPFLRLTCMMMAVALGLRILTLVSERRFSFSKLGADRKYEKAVEMLDFSDKYVDVRETIAGNTYDGRIEEVRQMYIDVYGDVLNMTQEEFESQEQQRIAVYLRENQPVLLRGYSYDNSNTYKRGNNWAISYELVEKVQHPGKVGMDEVRYHITIDVTEDGLTRAGASIPEHYLRDEYDRYVYDEEGNMIELWNAREELVFYRVFDISTYEVINKLNEWHQSQEQ